MKKKQTLSVEIEKTIRLLIITLGIIITTLLIVFLVQTNQKAQQGYKLEQVRIQNEELKNLTQRLKAKVTDASTAETFKESQKLDQMEKPEHESEEYLLPEDNN